MASTITFGVPSTGWVYYQDKKLYDLTRDGLAPHFSFDTTQGRPETSVMIDPKTTALVVVDMQNFFLHPDCNDHPNGLEAADRITEVVAKCREIGIQIIWLNWGLTEEDLITMPPAVHKNFSGGVITLKANEKAQEGKGQSRRGFGSDIGGNRGRLLMAKSWNAELYEPLLNISDQDKDIFCPKNRMSGMWTEGTPLHTAVKDRFRTLLFTGVNTDQCVLGTLVDAYNRSFDCIMLSDCCGTPTPGGQDVTVWNVSKGYGFVTDSKTFLNGVELKTENEKLSHVGLSG
ncbi:Isochorismatase-like protein [Nemania sp. FL0031]|nr:Isochorismatase-like protein [Nemania sp. FL0031]